MFHSFFNSIVSSSYLSLFSHSFSFTFLSAGTANILQVLHFFWMGVITLRSGRLTETWWSVCISKSQRGLSLSFPRTYSGLCKNHLFVWLHFNSLHNSQWISLPIQSWNIIIIIIISFLPSFFLHMSQPVVVHFHECLRDSKSPYVFWTLIIILDNLSNVVWVSTVLILWFPMPIIYINVTHIFSSPTTSNYFLIFSLSFIFILAGKAKSTSPFFFLLINTRSGLQN